MGRLKLPSSKVSKQTSTNCVQDLVRDAFQSGLTMVPGMESHLVGVLKQTLDHPGNLVRARLVYQVSRLYALEEEASLDLAVAIEFFHTASLLFDDLPCMDDAMERRGIACPHKKFGEAATVLGALALINRAYGLLWRAINQAPPSVRLAATELVESCLGHQGVLNGQSYDLHFSPQSRSGREVMHVAMGKTVALIRLTLVLPAILGQGKFLEIHLLKRLAVFWGLSYQMLDDLKDLMVSPQSSGKTGQRDALLNRPNLALVVGAKATLSRLRRLVELGNDALEQLLKDSGQWDFLVELRHRFTSELVHYSGLASRLSGS